MICTKSHCGIQDASLFLDLSTVLTDSEYHKCILACDNGQSPAWGYNNHNPTGKKVEEICNSTNLFLVQDKTSTPTLLRRAHNTQHRPDLTLLSADFLNRYKSEVTEGIGKSDHRPIITTIESTSPKKFQHKTRWNFKKASWDLYNVTPVKRLKEIDLTKSNHHKIVNEETESFFKASSLTIPKGCRKKYKPFWNQNLDLAVQAREIARKRLEDDPTHVGNKIAYNRTAAIATRVLNSSKKNTFIQTCAELDLKREGTKAWSLLNNLSGENKTRNPKPLVTEKGTIADDQRKANEHNRFFASTNKANKLTEEDKKLLKDLKAKEKVPFVQTKTFGENLTLSELNKALKRLKPRKSPGPDGIHNEMLIHLGTEAKKILLEIINITWQKGDLPPIWKTAILKPILKKGKPAEKLSSYRPISLTSCFGKLAERMVNGRLIWWLETN